MSPVASEEREPLYPLDRFLLEKAVGHFGLPLHLIFKERFVENAAAFQAILQKHYPHSGIAFAVKSNPCRGAVRLAAEQGLGADAASPYEYRLALEESADDRLIVCNGNAKDDNYITLAIRMGSLIAVDSRFEWERVRELAAYEGNKARVLLRLSGLPTEGWTDSQQSTAERWTKFGMALEELIALAREASADRFSSWEGISVHLGTQICDPEAFRFLASSLYQTLRTLAEAGLSVSIVDIGGGYPLNFIGSEEWKILQQRLWHQIRNNPPPAEWVTWGGHPMGFAAYIQSSSPLLSDEPPPWKGKAYWSPYPKHLMVEQLLNSLVEEGLTFKQALINQGEPLLIIEPGRALIGSAGITIAKVLGVKEVMNNRVVVVDLGIVNQGTVLITPDIHPMEVFPPSSNDEPVEVFIAGRLCFSGDMISKVKVRLNRLPGRGDWLVIHHTGAYCADHFASHNCGYPLPAKVAIGRDGDFEVWRAPEDPSHLFPSL